MQALRPLDFQKGWGWGESPCLPGAACPILLPAGDGRVEKVCPCTIKYLICVCVSVAQLYPTLATPWTVAHQAPLSKGFSRQEYWRGLPFPSPGDLPDPGIEPTFPALQVDSLLSEPTGKPGFQKGICLLAGPLFLTLCKPKPDHSAQTSQMLSMQRHWRGGCWNP